MHNFPMITLTSVISGSSFGSTVLVACVRLFDFGSHATSQKVPNMGNLQPLQNRINRLCHCKSSKQEKETLAYK